MIKKTLSFPALCFVLMMPFFVSCGGSGIKSQLVGTFTLTDMQPILNGTDTLSAIGNQYIERSKSINVDVTTISFNEDGTFKRVFPDVQNNNQLTTWNGTYTVDEDKKSISIKVEVGGKKGNFEFEIKDINNGILHLVGPYGKIKMNYIYKK